MLQQCREWRYARRRVKSITWLLRGDRLQREDLHRSLLCLPHLLALLLLTATNVLLVQEVTLLLSMAPQLLLVLPSRLVALLGALPDRVVLLCLLVVGTSGGVVALVSGGHARLVASSRLVAPGLLVLASKWIALVSDLHASLIPPSRLAVPVGQVG